MRSLLKGGIAVSSAETAGEPARRSACGSGGQSAVALEGVLPGGVPAQSGVYKRSVHSGRPPLFNWVG